MRKILFCFIYTSLLLTASCAFTPHKDARVYKTNTNIEARNSNTNIDILVTGEESNVVGFIRNGFGTETANIEIPNTKRELIQSALEQEFLANGFKIDPKASLKVLAKIKQVELELAQEDGKAGYYAICDLQIYLKQDKKLVERNFVENDKIDSYWVVTASEGISTFYNSVNKCSSAIVAEVAKRIKK
jgi:uncharacterized lipoprotein YajG